MIENSGGRYLPVLGVVLVFGIAGSAFADVGRDTLRETADAAIDLIERDGVAASMPTLEEPPFFDRGSGLHVWAMDGDAIVVLDASEQTSPGDDLSTFSLDGDTPVSVEIREAIAAGEVIVWHDLVPHAVTGELSTSQVWCVESTDVDGYEEVVLCAMAWFDEE
ncbi:hypothetical protein [Fodinicurvata sp. EGI_FJ10296]|uniref:hypothetical protein n=1 Tax=Fodinicurvata sp. EGI_FJ10296 TaxID=3231908 RepID=UPI0034556BAF